MSKRCPMCDLEMDFSEAEPDVGIMSSAWICSHCDHAFEADDCDMEPEYDPR
jgi:transposase